LRSALEKARKTLSQKQAGYSSTHLWFSHSEVEVGGSLSEASLDKSVRAYLKNKLKQKGLGAWFKWWSTCLASTRP
jgi:hypothetical protein